MDLRELSFREVVVGDGCSASITINDLPVGATPVWFEIPDELAGHMLITDVKVGRDSQFGSTAAVPGALFARRSPRDEFLMDTVKSPDNSLSISVSNLGRDPLPFLCRPVFSDDSTRLARYRRARLVGLGAARISPFGSLVVNVQPSVALDPDRIFVPREILGYVDVESIEVHRWRDGEGPAELLDFAPAEQLRREHLEGDGIFRLSMLRSVGPGECFAVRFKNRTETEVVVTGAILGGRPLPKFVP